MRRVRLGNLSAVLAVLCVLFAAGCATKHGVTAYTPAMEQAATTMQQAMDHIGAKQGDTNLLVLTNAPSVQMGGQPALPYMDVAMQVTGCTLGTRSLLAIQSGPTEALWFSLYNRDNGQLGYMVSGKSGFKVQYVDARPQTVLTSKGWSQAAKGIIAPNMFRTVGISLVWAASPPWNTLKAIQLHNHICPGLSAGIAVSEYIMKNLPPAPGEKVVFVGAPPFCAMDAYQMLFDATSGKKGSFSMLVGNEVLKEHGYKNSPACIYLRVNPKKDTCKGAILTFDFDKAAGLAGLTYADLSPKGGPSNPMFYISRVKIARVLAGLSTKRKMGLVAVDKTFEGNAELAKFIENANADPYGFAR